MPTVRREPLGLLPASVALGAGAAQRAEQVLAQVRAVRTKLLRLGTRKLRHKIAPLLRMQGVAHGRDALFTLLRYQVVTPSGPADCAQAQLHENGEFPPPLPLPPQLSQGCT